jgi:hypothetical protein
MFLFRLALALGKTVKQLVTELDSMEITEWQAYDAITPIGPERGDVQAALIASTVINVNRSEGARAATLTDLLLDWDPVEPDADATREAIKQALIKTMAIQKEAAAEAALRKPQQQPKPKT